MMICIFLLLNLALADTPDYLADHDRNLNQTWAGRPVWSKDVPSKVTIHYADITEDMAVNISTEHVKFEYQLPEFAKVKNRFFWVEDSRVFYQNDGAKRYYTKAIDQLLDYLLKNNIKIHSHLVGVPLTSGSTLKVFDPRKPKDYIFLKLINSGWPIEVSDVLNMMHKSNYSPDFYPEVEERLVKIKNQNGKKDIILPRIKIRSSKPMTSYEVKDSDYAIPLHSFMANEKLLEKVAAHQGLDINHWFLKVYSQKLSELIYKSYYILGVLPHAHSQNIVVILSDDLRFKGFVIRDLLDIHYNPIIPLTHIGGSVFHIFTNNIVNYLGKDHISRFKNKLLKKMNRFSMSHEKIGRVIYKTQNVDSFELALTAYFGRIFDLLPGESRGETFNKTVFLNFILPLASATLDSEYDLFKEKALEIFNKNAKLVGFQLEVSKLYNDMLMDNLSETLYTRRDLNNYYLKEELAKSFVEAIKNSEVGFFYLRSSQWAKWARSDKYNKIYKDIINNKNFELYSNGKDIIMLKDTSENKWIAVSHRSHEPTRLLEHKVLKPRFSNIVNQFKANPISCRLLFQ